MQIFAKKSSRESGWFFCGRFHDECAKSLPSKPIKFNDKKDIESWGLTLQQRLVMNLQTINDLLRACETGSKYIYQALPRLLTLYFNVGEDDEAAYVSTEFKTMSTLIGKSIKTIPMYKVRPAQCGRRPILIVPHTQWYTAFPQIVSRIGHPQKEIWAFLKELIRLVIYEHPNQALWQFTSVLQSKQEARKGRAEQILRKLKVSDSIPWIALADIAS